MIRIDAIWLATEPIDMRAGTETALARLISVFGAPHASIYRMAQTVKTWRKPSMKCCERSLNLALQPAAHPTD